MAPGFRPYPPRTGPSPTGHQCSGPDAAPNREFGAALRDSPIVLTNNQIVQGPEIADHALAMLLYLTRRLYDPAWRTLAARSSLFRMRIWNMTRVRMGAWGLPLRSGNSLCQ